MNIHHIILSWRTKVNGLLRFYLNQLFKEGIYGFNRINLFFIYRIFRYFKKCIYIEKLESLNKVISQGNSENIQRSPDFLRLMESILEQMVGNILKGMEIDIYDISEMSSIYWLLGFLTNNRLQLLLRIEDKNNQKLVQLQTERLTYLGLFKAFVGLERVKDCLDIPLMVLESREYAFQTRMGLFRILTQAGVLKIKYADFTEATKTLLQENPTVDSILLAAIDLMKQATLVCSAQSDVKRALIAAQVTLRQVMKSSSPCVIGSNKYLQNLIVPVIKD